MPKLSQFFCVYCDKRLTAAEYSALTDDEKTYFYILCERHLRIHRDEARGDDMDSEKYAQPFDPSYIPVEPEDYF